MLLDVSDLTVKYGKITALHEVSLQLEEGKLTTLLGANGAGKTTLLKTISRLLNPAQGQMVYLGNRLEKMSPDAVVKAGIAHCPEGRRVFPRQTVLENLRMGAYVRNDGEIEQDIERAFERFPKLRTRCDHPAGHLSGGEQQMLAISRALMSRPKLLLLDEPSMGLAPVVVKDVFQIIRDINAEGTAILLVEQNAKQALKVAQHAYVLEVGKITIGDDAKALLNSEAIRKSYLGG